MPSERQGHEVSQNAKRRSPPEIQGFDDSNHTALDCSGVKISSAIDLNETWSISISASITADANKLEEIISPYAMISIEEENFMTRTSTLEFMRMLSTIDNLEPVAMISRTGNFMPIVSIRPLSNPVIIYITKDATDIERAMIAWVENIERISSVPRTEDFELNVLICILSSLDVVCTAMNVDDLGLVRQHLGQPIERVATENSKARHIGMDLDVSRASIGSRKRHACILKDCSHENSQSFEDRGPGACHASMLRGQC
ncbi:hypothetical protein BDZ45DRAFT_743828 [Acephala macrosclerotiorum]|nr:hypothetical protein BDZ45DRAFT_743828 [Acephala macrosclerotiorum]